MTTKVLTKSPTEGDLEAAIHAALCRAFPWLPEDALKHQTRFSFAIGRAHIEVDGAATTAEGRTDVLVTARGKPLAVFELKREGSALTREDEEQGLSYAKVMNPPYPLVVITNGKETRILASHTGAAWQPETPSEEEFAKLTEAAGRTATGSLKEAVATLMGTVPGVWMQAVRSAAVANVEELTGGWNDFHLPFVRGFLYPRKAAWAANNALREENCRFVLIQGPPLVGKSNVLREIMMRSLPSADFAVLYVAADEGRGILQAIADLLSSALSWPVTADEARRWLQQVSRAGGPALVLAVDGIGPDDDAARRELEDLSSDVFGPQLRLLVTADEAVVTKLMTHPNGRQASAIGRRVDAQIAFGLLDDGEFDQAAKILWDHRLAVQHGGGTSHELRVPWVLRALGGQYAPTADDPPDRAAVLPAQLSLDVIGHARERFRDAELRRCFRGLAHAMLEDAEDTALPLALKLEAMATFVVRRETLQRHLDRLDIDGLMARGYLKPALHDAGLPVLIVRLPELVASETSRALGGMLRERARTDARAAAEWLVAVTSRISLGDVIAAHSFADAIEGSRGIPLDVVHTLAGMRPRWNSIAAGTRAAMHVDGVGMVDMTFDEDGSWTATVGGETRRFAADEDDAPRGMLGNHHPWMILSHLAGQRMAYGADDTRLDLELLGLVGSCEHVLRRPDAFLEGRGVMTHWISGYGEVVCHAAGIVEPITFSLFRMLSREGPQQEEWIGRAVESESLGLLARTDIALRETARLADPVLRPWAQGMLERRIAPALSGALECVRE